MSNITMSIDDQLLKKARKIAFEHNTSVNSMVREFLKEKVAAEEMQRDLAVSELKQIYRKSKAGIGKKVWSRNDLHER